MITLENYGSILGKNRVGKVHKEQSDLVIDKTWWTDIAARVGYFYDYDSDTHIKQLNNMSPLTDNYKIPIDIKYFASSLQTYSKDNVTYHLQLRPYQSSDVIPYYKEKFEDRYSAIFPVGLYLDVEDAQDRWNRWLVVAGANVNDPQFPTYEILRCDKIINFICNGKKYFVPAVLRSQNSYNSGIWTDYRITSIEDQYKFLVPLNRITELLYYNQRLIIDADNILTEPRAWKVSKVNRLASPGIALITLAQDKFDPNADYRDEDGIWWADYYSHDGVPNVPNEAESVENINGVITCAGSQNIKVRGSYKKLKITYFNKDKEIETVNGTWHFYFNDSLIDDIISVSHSGVADNEIKIKFMGEPTYIGKEIVVKYIPVFGESVEFNLPVISL